MSKQLQKEFTQRLLNWFDDFGRHDLPWQQHISPYRVWVSEIMLQQTQVATVIPYYQRFMQRFPNVHELAAASQEEVLTYWAGLGYYARGRNLHKAAQYIEANYHGEFPDDFESIIGLPGIGRSTAGAILSISLQQRFAILDGNVKRVLSRYFAVEGWPGQKAVENTLWEYAESLTPQQRYADYTQAIMDLGATLCKRSKPGCEACPVKEGCQAFAEGDVTRFPFSKPKKNKPIKQAWFLLEIAENNKVRLYKRPQSGIWAGLWSLPQFDDLPLLHQYLQSQAIEQNSLVEWEPFRHTFSHYHLDIKPMVLQHKNQLKGGDDSALQALKIAEGAGEYIAEEVQWFELESCSKQHLGLPAPMEKLLTDYALRN